MPFRWILVLGWLAAIAVQARSQPLYDGALGTLPSDQEWLYFAARGLAEQRHTGSADVEIAEVALVLAPVLHARGPDHLEWEGVPGQTYTVQGSPGWGPWTTEAQVH